MVRVVLQGLVKKFGETVALDHFSLEVRKGEFCTLLGPSGCGKTTALRIVAGFYEPDEGEVYFGDQPMSRIPPEKRGTAMVFQNYALFPHMTVFDNVAYGLKVRSFSSEQIHSKVSHALETVGLTGLEKRYPSALSGGQQQRVALARAVVVEPRVLLLDEPLSNLDAKLRVSTRRELVHLQKKLGITAIYVTHDQEEALSISDRVAVVFKGRVAQVGTPWEIYDEPNDIMVAEFVGAVNLIHCRILARKDGRIRLGTRAGIMLEIVDYGQELPSEAVVMIRPEKVRIVEELEGPNIIKARMLRRTYSGEKVGFEFEFQDASDGVLKVTALHLQELPFEGGVVGLQLPPGSLRFMSAGSS